MQRARVRCLRRDNIIYQARLTYLQTYTQMADIHGYNYTVLARLRNKNLHTYTLARTHTYTHRETRVLVDDASIELSSQISRLICHWLALVSLTLLPTSCLSLAFIFYLIHFVRLKKKTILSLSVYFLGGIDLEMLTQIFN